MLGVGVGYRDYEYEGFDVDTPMRRAPRERRWGPLPQSEAWA